MDTLSWLENRTGLVVGVNCWGTVLVSWEKCEWHHCFG